MKIRHALSQKGPIIPNFIKMGLLVAEENVNKPTNPALSCFEGQIRSRSIIIITKHVAEHCAVEHVDLEID